jgi:uncharacterized OB-fold protein
MIDTGRGIMGANMEAITVKGRIDISYEFSAGIAGSRFLRELRDNKRIMGTRCNGCKRTLVPPRMYCEECFRDDMEWVDVGDKGTIYTFGVCYFSTEGTLLDKPWIVAIIRMDGCDGGLVHLIDEVDPGEVRMGMEVQAVFAEDRVGSILDIKYFRPIKS